MAKYVYDANIDKLQEKVNKLNRRAVKLGVPEIHLNLGPREKFYVRTLANGNREIIEDGCTFGPDEAVIQHEKAEVELYGDPPRLAGWTFLAVVDHLSGGVVTKYPHGKNIDLAFFRGADATCDHCKTVRQRHETFVVANENNETMRVGRNCLRDFLGHDSPEYLIGHLNLWSKAFEALEDEVEAGFGMGTPMLHLDTYLSFVVVSIEHGGWISRGKAYDLGYQSTACMAEQLYYDKYRPASCEATDEHRARAQRALAWVRALKDEEVEENDYLWNLRAVCQSDYIRPKRIGLAASVIVAAERAAEKALNSVLEALKSNEHIGEVKQRLTLELTLVGLREIDGNFGVTTMHRFEDPRGNCLVWWASNPEFIPVSKYDKRRMNIGETLKVKGTIKKHDNYDGRNQTVLNRLAVVK